MKQRVAPTWLHAALLALLLLAAQAAGLAHRVAHAPGAATDPVHRVWAPDHEHGSPECRLVDQLAHADALCGGAPALVAMVRHAAPARVPEPRSVAAGPAAAYLARAPPRG